MPRKNRIAIGKDFVNTMVKELVESTDNNTGKRIMVPVSMPKTLLDRAMAFRKTRTTGYKEPQYMCFERIVKFYEDNYNGT